MHPIPVARDGGRERLQGVNSKNAEMRRSTKRSDMMSFLPVVFGLGEAEAAAAIGVSATKFRILVKDKRMPSPRRLDGRNLWDVDELRAAFKALPHEGEKEINNSWADVV
jgi:hypothetical protein